MRIQSPFFQTHCSWNIVKINLKSIFGDTMWKTKAETNIFVKTNLHTKRFSFASWSFPKVWCLAILENILYKRAMLNIIFTFFSKIFVCHFDLRHTKPNYKNPFFGRKDNTTFLELFFKSSLTKSKFIFLKDIHKGTFAWYLTTLLRSREEPHHFGGAETRCGSGDWLRLWC
jgi:hypothetical protein